MTPIVTVSVENCLEVLEIGLGPPDQYRHHFGIFTNKVGICLDYKTTSKTMSTVVTDKKKPKGLRMAAPCECSQPPPSSQTRPLCNLDTEEESERESKVVVVRRPDGRWMSFTISHRCEFEDGVQGTLQVGQVVCKQRHNSEAVNLHRLQSTGAEVSIQSRSWFVSGI